MDYKELLFNDKIIASVIFIFLILRSGIGGSIDELLEIIIFTLFIWYFYLLWRNRRS